MLGREPTLIIQTVVAILTGIQQLTISTPQWVHVGISIGLIVCGALLNRSAVTPAEVSQQDL